MAVIVVKLYFRDEAGDDPSNANTDGYNAEDVDSNNTFSEDMFQMALKMATGELDEPAVDLEAALTSSTITPSQSQTQNDASGENDGKFFTYFKYLFTCRVCQLEIN